MVACRLSCALCTLLVILSPVSCATLLLFTRTTDYRHDSIPTAISAIQSMSRTAGFNVLASEDPALFSDGGLANISAVAFRLQAYPTAHSSEPLDGPTLLDSTQQAALQRFFARGGGYIGIHAGNACLFSVDFYRRVAGALFDYHPDLQPATFTVVDASHPSTSSLPARWTFTEEVYSFRSDPRQTNVTLLLSVDESSYTDAQRGSRPYSQGNPHPIAWFREASTPGLDLGNASYATGRAWYTSLGHSIETWQNTTFLGHVQGGITWVLAAQSASPLSSAPSGSLMPSNGPSSTTASPAVTSARSSADRPRAGLAAAAIAGCTILFTM